MISNFVQPRVWPHRQWWSVVIFLFLLQVGIIFWLGERERMALREAGKGMTLAFAPNQRAEIPGLSNPTLFVLANPHGFSGPAWLTIPQMDYDVPEWAGPTNLLNPPVKQLGETFSQFVHSSQEAGFEIAAKPEPKVEIEEFFPVLGLVNDQSKFWLEGELANRPMVSTLELNPVTASELLTNTVIQVAAEPDGRVFSTELLSRSGSKEA